LQKECNHESTIDVGLVPRSSSPLSLDDVSGDSIRAVAYALILRAGRAQSIDRCGGRRTTLSQAQYSLECSLAKMTLANLVGQIREKTHRVSLI
jgi:hypothetical protein